MKVYIAGPMTGMPEYNFPAFHKAAAAWRAAGWDVVNPAESFDGDTSRVYRDYVRHDLQALRSCHAIALLPGWDGPNARGSVWEREVAEAVFGLHVFDADDPMPHDPFRLCLGETVLQEAQRLVYGERQNAYGHPYEDYTRTARLWEAILGLPHATISPRIACLMMAAVKISREVNQPKRDNLVDLAGYAACAHRCTERAIELGQTP